MSDIDDIIAGGGMVFKGMPKGDPNKDKVKTKAKKKKYITGGFNLQIAWSSAVAAARALSR